MKKLLIILYFIFVSTFLSAHPHVFFEGSFNLKLNTKEVVVDLELILDEMNTLLVKENNGNEELYKNIFNDLKISYNGKILEKSVIKKEIDSSSDNIILNITFNFPIELKKDDRLLITIYDREYFYDYDYDENSFKIENNSNLNFVTDFKENKKKAYYYDMVYPKEFEVIVNEK